MNVAAITTIAGLEVRQRIRSTRWKWTLAILFALISLLILGSLFLTVGVVGVPYRDWARYLYDLTLGIVLFLGLAAAPTMSATSINGDRRDATLALVQATPITSVELTVGKLLGSWLASLVLIGVALPYLLWGLFQGPMSIVAGVLGIVVTALLLAAYCAIGLGFSAITSRPAASAMLTQATVLTLLIGLPIVFGMTVPLVTQKHEVREPQTVFAPGEPVTLGSARTCDDAPREQSFLHTEWTWWLLLPNPLLVVGDAVSSGVYLDAARRVNGGASLGGEALSMARAGPNITDHTCAERTAQGDDWYSLRREADARHEMRYIGHSWYLGLLVNLALGGIGLWVASRRLRVPAQRLSRGVRVA